MHWYIILAAAIIGATIGTLTVLAIGRAVKRETKRRDNERAQW
jgi:membrane protein YqaA with SNARE-associated domain